MKKPGDPGPTRQQVNQEQRDWNDAMEKCNNKAKTLRHSMLDDPDFKLSKDEMDGVNESFGSDEGCFQLTQGTFSSPGRLLSPLSGRLTDQPALSKQ